MYQPFHLRSARPKYEATSPGERLWFCIRDWWYSREEADGFAVDRTSLDWIDSRKRVGLALSNAAVSDACVRIIRRANAALDDCDLERDPAEAYRAQLVDTVRQYCVSPMGFSFADRILTIIGHLAFECAVVARQEIAVTTRTNIHRTFVAAQGQPTCYICGLGLVRPYSLDHLWPQSLGGSSLEENLLPACATCNGRKMDRIGWDTFGVVIDYAHLGGTADGNQQTNMALHHRAAAQLAERDRITIKEAFRSSHR